MRPSRVVVALFGSVVFLTSGAARAAEEPVDEGPPPFAILPEVSAGILSSEGSRYGSGTQAALSVLARYTLLEGGLSAGTAAEVLAPGTRHAYSALLGVGTHSYSIFGGELLFEAGVHDYRDVGHSMFSRGSRGPDGSSRFLGVRLGATVHRRYRPGQHVGALGGVWLFMNRDLDQAYLSPAADGSGYVAWQVPPAFASATRIGGATEIGVGLRFGLDVMP